MRVINDLKDEMITYCKAYLVLYPAHGSHTNQHFAKRCMSELESNQTMTAKQFALVLARINEDMIKRRNTVYRYLWKFYHERSGGNAEPCGLLRQKIEDMLYQVLNKGYFQGSSILDPEIDPERRMPASDVTSVDEVESIFRQ